jgi:hypothetical protein
MMQDMDDFHMTCLRCGRDACATCTLSTTVSTYLPLMLSCQPKHVPMKPPQQRPTAAPVFGRDMHKFLVIVIHQPLQTNTNFPEMVMRPTDSDRRSSGGSSNHLDTSWDNTASRALPLTLSLTHPLTHSPPPSPSSPRSLNWS